MRRRIARHSSLALALLATAWLWGAAPVPFSALFRNADTAVIGTVESSKRIPASDARAKTEPVQLFEGAPSYLCEFAIRVGTLLKAVDRQVGTGAVVLVVSFTPSPACAPGYQHGDLPPDRPALWLLRTEEGMLRTLVDNSDTVFALTRGLLPLEEQDLRQWKEPDVAVTYLFLKPGLAIPESRYTDSALPIQMVDLGGWTKFLRVYRTAYLESDGYARGRINLVAASFEHCLDAARRTTQGGGPLPELAPMLPFLDRDTAWRTETTELEGLSWASKEELLAAFNSPEAAVDELTRWACSSGTRIKARARDLLSRYFGVDPSTLPCIPCE